MVFTQRCAGCNQPGVELCHPCRFSLASSPMVTTPDGVMAAVPFDGVARRVVLSLKYRNRRQLAAVLADMIVRRTQPGSVDIVTWAPTSLGRARRRGYDQAELMARAVAKRLGVPCRRLLYRAHGEAQTGHSRVERLAGPEFRGHLPRPGLRVLLVDDVVTTGATLRAARRELFLAGVAEVCCVAAAATPDRSQSVAPSRTRAETGLARAG